MKTMHRIIAILPDGQEFRDEVHVGSNADRLLTREEADVALARLDADRPDGHEDVTYRAEAVETPVIDGDRIEAGEPGTEDYDTGTVLQLDIDRDRAFIGWDSGVQTWAEVGDLRPL